MIPRFSSESDLRSFLKALPQTVNFGSMLQKDFSKDPAVFKSPEYTWKYLMYTSVVKNNGEAVYEDPREEDVEAFIEKNPEFKSKEVKMPHIVEGAPVENKNILPKTEKKVVVPDGTPSVKFNEELQKWEGFVGKRVVTRKKDKEKLIERMVQEMKFDRSAIQGA